MINPEEISDQEIEKYKGFEKVLLNSKQTPHSTLKPILLSSFIAVIAILAIVFYSLYFNINTRGKKIKNVEVKKNIVDKATTTIAAETIVKVDTTIAKPIHKKSKVATKVSPKTKSISANASFAEAHPIGGYEKLFHFFQANLNYPSNAKQNRIEGNVLIEFYVSADGKIEDIAVLQGLNSELDAEALRLISIMPPWKPAMLDGAAISVRQTLPVKFKIE